MDPYSAVFSPLVPFAAWQIGGRGLRKGYDRRRVRGTRLRWQVGTNGKLGTGPCRAEGILEHRLFRFCSPHLWFVALESGFSFDMQSYGSRRLP